MTTAPNIPNTPAVALMNVILADQFMLYTKARNYHWNVTGPNFFGLHAAFEKIYDGLADDIDAIAERIRVLGANAPGTLREFLALTSIAEEAGTYPAQSVMVKNITADLEAITGTIASAAKKIQNDLHDEVTAGMLYALIEKYEKTVWMLKAATV